MTQNKFKEPDCWNDDERMNALFQPFRPKQVNPHHYTTKLTFWQELIYNYCKNKKGDPSFSRKEIQLAFKRKQRLPLCLQTVVEDMIAQKLIERKDVILSNPHNTWTTWAINSFVRSPVKWGVNRVWGASEDNEELKFYHVSLLKELSEEVYQILMDHPGKVLKTEDLVNILKSKITLTENGLSSCVFYLHQQNKILTEFEIKDGDIKIQVVKIPGKDGTKEKLTDVDKSMLQLRETKEVLSNQIEKLEEEISSYQEMARKCVQEKNPRMAKIHLKRKMFIQNQCDKKSDILQNIDTLITNMEDAQSHGEILSVYKMGSESLKSLMAKSGLTVENVDEIMSTMKEITEDHEEIQNTLSNSTITSTYDDDSLEDELKEILGEAAAKKIDFNQNKTADNQKLENELIDLLENLEVETATPNMSTLSLENLLAE